jgi:hypothetical protein
MPYEVEKRWWTTEIKPGLCTSQEVTPDHWNAGRAYVFEKDPTANSNNTTDPYALNGDYQLVEYTFRGSNGPTPGTLGTGVGYNYSGVDSVNTALPLAVEATNSQGIQDPDQIGYTGNYLTAPTNTDTGALDAAAQKLVDAGWPYYPDSSSGNKYKFPGGYNVYALANTTTPLAYTPAAGKSPMNPKALTEKWTNWVRSDQCGATDQFCNEFQQSVRIVWQAFQKNAIDNGVKNPSDQDIAQHITGFVPFGDKNNWVDIEGTDVNQRWIGLASGVPTKDAHPDRKYPDYDSPYNLDPYVSAVHNKNNFNMNVYAYSIDDAEGYFSVQDHGLNNSINADKLIIAVGGYANLPNTNPAVQNTVSPYQSMFGGGWDHVSICGGTVRAISEPKPIPLPLVPGKSCTVVYTADNSKFKAGYTVSLDGQTLNFSQKDPGIYTYKPDNNTTTYIQGPGAPAH